MTNHPHSEESRQRDTPMGRPIRVAMHDVRAKGSYEGGELQEGPKVSADPGPTSIVVQLGFDDPYPPLLQVSGVGPGRANDCLLESGIVQIAGEQSKALLRARNPGRIVQEKNSQWQIITQET